MEYYTESYVKSLEKQIEELKKDKDGYIMLCEKWKKISDDLFDIIRNGGAKNEKISD